MLSVEIYSREKILLKEESVESIIVPSPKGDFVILQDHAPIISLLVKGKIHLTIAGSVKTIAILSGYLQFEENRASFMIDELPAL